VLYLTIPNIQINQIIYFQATWPIERQNTETHS